MNQSDDGAAPAFPCRLPDHTALHTAGTPTPVVAYGGITIRDYFAANALHALMANSGGYWNAAVREGYANIAYMTADAMIAERAKQGE